MSTNQQILKFLASGGIATIVHWLSMCIFIELGSDPFASTCMGASIGAIVNYFLQRTYTFSVSRNHSVLVPKYLVATVTSWSLNASLFYSLNTLLQVDVVFSQFIATSLTTLMNFMIFKYCVFYSAKNSN